MALRAREDLLEHIQKLEERLQEAEETLGALRRGEVDAVVASGPNGDCVYTLRGADEAYRIMVENMAEGALSVKPDGLILFSNEQFALRIGVPLARVIGSSMYDFIAAEDAAMLSAVLAASGGMKAEVRLDSQAGKSIPAQIAANRLLLDGMESVCLIVTDLSEQKQNLEVMAAERLARSILDQTAGAILVVEPGGRIIRASRAAEEMANGGVLLQMFDEVICLRTDSNMHSWALRDLLVSLKRGPIAGLEAKAQTPDGRLLDVLLSASLLTGSDLECQGCIVLLHDISGLKQAQRSTRQLSEQRGLALEAGKLGSWEYRFDSGYVSWDERCRDMFGIRTGTQINYDAAIDRIHIDDRSAALTGMKLAIGGDCGGTYDQEFRVVWPDGSLHWVASHAQAYFESHGEHRTAVRFVGVNQEITERKLAEEGLKRTLDEKVALLEEIHHRVKNNLQIVCSLLAMQADSVKDQETAAQLQDCERRVTSMAMIHQQLYNHDDLSSVDLGGYGQDLAAQLFACYSRSALTSYRLEATSIRLPIEQAIPCGLILNELITNAFKYAYPDGKGEILIAISSVGPLVSMTVSDQGVGLPVDFNWETSKSLGMTLVHVLTEQIDGEIEIGAPPGASFTVRFMKKAAPPAVSGASA